MTSTPALKIHIRLYAGDEIAMGPGKADLLDAIVREGSISGAGRALGMSYRRAWLLVDTMNRCWPKPLVHTQPGSSKGGGAKVTAYGLSVLARYRSIQSTATQAVASDCDHLLDELKRTLHLPYAPLSIGTHPIYSGI